MPVKYPAKGTQVKHGASAAPTTVLGQLKSANISPGMRTLIESTTHDNTVTKSYVDSGLRDTPDLDMTVVLDPADTGHEAVRAAHAAGTPYFFTLILPDVGAAQWALSGIILEVSVPALTPQGLLEMTIKFKATSADTYTQ